MFDGHGMWLSLLLVFLGTHDTQNEYLYFNTHRTRPSPIFGVCNPSDVEKKFDSSTPLATEKRSTKQTNAST